MLNTTHSWYSFWNFFWWKRLYTRKKNRNKKYDNTIFFESRKMKYRKIENWEYNLQINYTLKLNWFAIWKVIKTNIICI